MKKVCLVIMLICAMFMSCNGPFGSNGEEILESAVFDGGIDAEVEESVVKDKYGVEGTELTYKSWIMVKGQLRGDFEERVEVELTNIFRDVNTAIEVSSFDLGEYSTSLTHKVRKIRQEGFVDVVDTVLVYTVSFDSISFDYEIDYEVGVYDDGVTKQIMPYYSIGTIKDNGYKFEDLDFVIDDEYGTEWVYLRKLLTHSISVEFQGKKYDMEAIVELRKCAGQHPCVVKSMPILLEFTVWQNDPQNEGSFVEVESVLVICRTWSDGTEESAPMRCYLGNYVECNNFESKVIKGYKNDLAIVSSGFCNVVSEPRAVNEAAARFVKAIRNYKEWCINYNYFDIAIKFVCDEAWYDDGVIRCKMPSPENLTELVNEPTIMDPFYTGENEEGKYQVYQFTQDVSARYGGQLISGWGKMGVTVYE